MMKACYIPRDIYSMQGSSTARRDFWWILFRGKGIGPWPIIFALRDAGAVIALHECNIGGALGDFYQNRIITPEHGGALTLLPTVGRWQWLSSGRVGNELCRERSMVVKMRGGGVNRGFICVLI